MARDPLALADLAFLLLAAYVFALSYFSVWRPRVRPEVFLGVAAVVGLAATAWDNPSLPLRVTFVLVGATAIMFQVWCSVWSQQRWENEARVEREAAQTRFNATMERHDDAFKAASDSRESAEKASAVTASILSGLQRRMEASARLDLLRRSYVWIDAIDELMAPYRDMERLIQDKGDELRKDGTYVTAMREVLQPLNDELSDIITATLTKFEPSYNNALFFLFSEYHNHRSIDCSDAMKTLNAGVKIYDIEALQQRLGEAARKIPQ